MTLFHSPSESRLVLDEGMSGIRSYRTAFLAEFQRLIGVTDDGSSSMRYTFTVMGGPNDVKGTLKLAGGVATSRSISSMHPRCIAQSKVRQSWIKIRCLRYD